MDNKHILLMLGILISSLLGAQSPIIPTPSSYVYNSNGWTYIDGELSIDTSGIGLSNWNYLESQLREIHGITLKHQGGIRKFKFQKTNQVGHTYGIKVDEYEIRVQYGTQESMFYAINSLLQLIRVNSEGKYIEHCTLQDTPKYPWRGLHLDVSRHFYNVAEVKRFIDLMALYKFNVFHWHLTDDQGWRIEIAKYPKLTSIGGHRDSTVIGHYSDSPRAYHDSTYGGYYSKDEIREVVKYAEDRFITVVPEIEMPGHSRAALAAHPELSCTGELNPVPGLWGVFDDIYCSKAESINFMKDVLSEVIELFPSEYIHIGGDEAPKARWKECKDCQKVIQENGLKDEHELQSYFIRKIDSFLTSEGRKLIGWDEILEGGLSPNAAVMSWRGEAGGIEAAKQGHEVVMTPTTYCYFDYYQSSHASEPLAIGGYLPLEKVYQFSPAPDELTEEEAKFILGGQANLWTEYIPTMEKLEYMAYPRALALIQSLWCTTKPKYEQFLKTYINHHERYLDLHGVHYSKSIHYPSLSVERSPNGINVRFININDESSYDVMTTVYGRSKFKNGLVMTNTDSLFLERNFGTEKVMKCVVSSDDFPGKAEYEFNLNSTLGLPIEMLTTPHPKFNHNGSLNLVDGVKGGLPWKGSEWLGFQEQKIEFVIDLEADADIESLEIGLLSDIGSWIYRPTGVSVFKSKKGKKWEKTDQHEIAFSDSSERILLEMDVSSEARFIKVCIKAMDEIPRGHSGAGHVPWTFIDEIELNYRKNEN